MTYFPNKTFFFILASATLFLSSACTQRHSDDVASQPVPISGAGIIKAGSLDLNFNGTGTANIEDVSISATRIQLTIQNDKKILLLGTSESNGIHSILLTRFNEQGTLDPTFGAGT